MTTSTQMPPDKESLPTTLSPKPSEPAASGSTTQTPETPSQPPPPATIDKHAPPNAATTTLNGSSTSSAKPTAAVLSSFKSTGKRGNPGHFTDVQREFFESHYDEFATYGRNDKGKFWDSFFPAYFELFPLEKFPPPPEPKPLENITQSDLAALPEKQRRARKKNEKRRELDLQGRMKESVKNWFQQRQQKGSNRAAPFIRHMSSVQKDPPPRKRQLRQFLVTHPDYKNSIMARSKETSARDRLDKRLDAAMDIIREMPKEEREKVTQERDELHKNATAVWVERNKSRGLSVSDEDRAAARKSLPIFVQPLLDMVRDLTGYSVVLQASIDTGNSNPKKRFETVSMCSTHQDATEFVNFNLQGFQRFGTDFNEWLWERPASPNTHSEEPDVTKEHPGSAVSSESVSSQPVGKRKRSSKGTKSKRKTGERKRKGKDVEEEEEDEEEEEEDEDSPVLDDDDDGVDQLDSEEPAEEERGSEWRRGVPYSPYELARMDNIARNQRLLAELGLGDASVFIRGSKLSTSQQPDNEKPMEEAEKEPPAQRPRPKPTRVLRSSRNVEESPAGGIDPPATLLEAQKTPSPQQSPSQHAPSPQQTLPLQQTLPPQPPLSPQQDPSPA
ncbi:hypothetical protein V5O48_013438 [Marasmius crinis-equi]|uniref:Uncharacterized protein n=1 Tax=Marasmius crinis-equi TaxID=585013 RepID=A0ABR3F020_9AGAR